MKRKLSPRPWRQAERAHRQRLALGRALHHVNRLRRLLEREHRSFSRPRRYGRLHVPKALRKHARMLRNRLVFAP